MRRIFRKLRIPMIIGLLTIFVFRFILLVGVVPTESMEPTIPRGSFILALRIYGELSVGDIIVFQKNQNVLVKRVAAGPGDVVYVNRVTGDISVNNAINADIVYTVPEDGFFVTGDHAEESKDSRYWEEPFVWASEILALLC